MSENDSAFLTRILLNFCSGKSLRQAYLNGKFTIISVVIITIHNKTLNLKIYFLENKISNFKLEKVPEICGINIVLVSV